MVNQNEIFYDDKSFPQEVFKRFHFQEPGSILDIFVGRRSQSFFC